MWHVCRQHHTGARSGVGYTDRCTASGRGHRRRTCSGWTGPWYVSGTVAGGGLASGFLQHHQYSINRRGVWPGAVRQRAMCP